MSIELDKRSINHLFGGWGSARNGKLTREWSLMTLLLLISKGRLLAVSRRSQRVGSRPKAEVQKGSLSGQ